MTWFMTRPAWLCSECQGKARSYNLPSFSVKLLKARMLYATQCYLIKLGLRIDTVGVWGSSPHVPTNSFGNLASPAEISVTPDYAILRVAQLGIRCWIEHLNWCQLNDNYADPTTAGWVSAPPQRYNGQDLGRLQRRLCLASQIE